MPYKNTEDRKSYQRQKYLKHKTTKPFLHKCTRVKSRSQYLKVPFNLTPEYLESIWTGVCPVSGVTLKWETDRLDEAAAELDRIIPDKGYVKGNVIFLSRRINRLKNNASLDELRKLVSWLESKLN